MATTTNYAWTTPDNSGLVKNGAQDIRTLGSAVDTSLWNVGFGQAGKNHIINGDFNIWQRGSSFTLTNNVATYCADRMRVTSAFSAGSSSVSRQTFTPGTAPVAGYESQYFQRITAGTTSSYIDCFQLIEDVRTFANQTVSFSFWAKASSAISMSGYRIQNFGSGGSAEVAGVQGTFSLTTSWQRFTTTFTVPSISGKTVGTSSYLAMGIYISSGIPSGVTIDTWGWQLEAGSVATPFQTASGGSPQAELAMCQRYYYRANATGSYSRFGIAQAINATTCQLVLSFPVVMRTRPTALEQSGTAANYGALNANANSVLAATAVPTFDSANTQTATVSLTVTSGLVSGNASQFMDNGTSSAYLGWSAEL